MPFSESSMPRSFLVKTTKRREDQGEGERGADNFGTKREDLLALQDVISYDRYGDSLRRLYKLSGENMRFTHGKPTQRDTKSEQMAIESYFMSAFKAKQTTGNRELIPPQLWFFPPMSIKDVQCCVPRYQMEAMAPIDLINEQERRSVSRIFNRDMSTREDEDTKKSGKNVFGTQDDTKHRDHYHLNETSSKWIPSAFYPFPRMEFAQDSKENKDHCNLPGNHFSSKRPRTVDESEETSTDKNGVGSVENLQSPSKKRRESETEILSPRYLSLSLDERIQPSVPKEGACDSENSRLAEKQNTIEEQNLSPNGSPSSMGNWKFQEPYEFYWEAKPRESQENERTPEKSISNEEQEPCLKRSESIGGNNEVITERRPDWYVSAPFATRLMERAGWLKYHNLPVRERKRHQGSSVWTPHHLLPNDELNGVLRDFSKRSRSEGNGFWHNVKQNEIFHARDNHPFYPFRVPLNPVPLKEHPSNTDFVDHISAEGNNRIRDDSYNGKEMAEVSRDKSRSTSPDHSNHITKPGRFSDNQKEKAAEPLNDRLSSPVEWGSIGQINISNRSPDHLQPKEIVKGVNQQELPASSLLSHTSKDIASEKVSGKLFSDHSTLALLNNERKPPRVIPEVPLILSCPPSPFWTKARNGSAPKHFGVHADKLAERSTKGKPNTTHHHRCEICGCTFQLRRLLNRHMKTHSFYKRYSCTFCDKGFNDTFDLKRHVRTHTGIKPFKCDKCDKSFTQRCSLEAHQSRIHGVTHKFGFRERRSKMFVCEECGSTFKEDQSEFMNHMAHAHPEKDKIPYSLAKRNNKLAKLVKID